MALINRLLGIPSEDDLKEQIDIMDDSNIHNLQESEVSSQLVSTLFGLSFFIKTDGNLQIVMSWENQSDDMIELSRNVLKHVLSGDVTKSIVSQIQNYATHEIIRKDFADAITKPLIRQANNIPLIPPSKALKITNIKMGDEYA